MAAPATWVNNDAGAGDGAERRPASLTEMVTETVFCSTAVAWDARPVSAGMAQSS